MRNTPASVNHAMVAGLLLSFLLIPTAEGQSDLTEFTILDPPGDVTASGAAIPLWLDLTEVTGLINATTFSVSFVFKDRLDAAEIGNRAEVWVAVAFRDEIFHIGTRTVAGTVGLQGEPMGYVYRSTLDSWLQIYSPHANQSGNMVRVDLPISNLKSSHDFSPVAGDRFQILDAESNWGFPTHHTSEAALPRQEFRDIATPEIETSIVVPGQQSQLLLSTAMPLRFSNGEATTFHWPVEIRNQGPATLATITWTAPAGIQLDHPSSIDVEAGQTKILDVFATVPFAHNHGDRLEAPLTISSENGSTTLALGIQYPEIPQPAGHHPTLFFHGPAGTNGASPRGVMWMNSHQGDPAGTAASLTPTSELYCTKNTDLYPALSWRFPLSPSLLLGLDARDDEDAQLHGTLEFAIPGQPGTLSARLDIVNLTNDGLTPFDLDQIGAKVIAAPSGQGQLPFDLLVDVPEHLNYSVPEDGRNLQLTLFYCSNIANDQSFRGMDMANGLLARTGAPFLLQAGGTIQLPLDEFHDKIVLGSKDSAVRLQTDNATQHIRPGGQAFWEVHATYQNGPAKFDVRLIGPSATFATLHSPGPLRLGPDATTILVSVPVDEDGVPEEIVLVVQMEGDPETSAALRLQAIPDEAGEDFSNDVDRASEPRKESPVNVGVVLLPVALAFLWRRRKFNSE